MNEVTISQAQKLSSPNPFGLLVTDADNRVNIMAVSWWTYVCNKPPMLAVALSKKGFSGDRIARSGRFTLCLPTDEIRKAAFSCGTVSGREIDKIRQFGIQMIPSAPDYPAMVQASCVAFLCDLNQIADVGDHTLYIADVKHIFADDTKAHLSAYKGYAELR